MFRNSEGYADPTAGLAIAHITHEECTTREKEKTRINAAKMAERAAFRMEAYHLCQEMLERNINLMQEFMEIANRHEVR